MSEQWLSIVEYARTFAMSDMTIRRRIKTGRLQAELREGKYYIPIGLDRSGKPLRLDLKNNSEVMRHPVRNSNEFDGDLATVTLQRTLSGSEHSPDREEPLRRVQSTQVTGQVVKSRVSSMSPSSQQRQDSQAPAGHYESGLIPGHIRLGIQESDTSMVESKALLDFCESVLRRFSRLEARLEEGFKTKMALLENQMDAKNQENNKLKQQIEDLQLLIKILERGPGPHRE